MPIGSDLSKQIKNGLSLQEQVDGTHLCSNKIIDSALVDHAGRGGPSIVELRNAARRIAQGLPLHLSIDNFMENHKDEEAVQVCGRIAIVHLIAAAEAKSKLANRAAIEASPSVGGWMHLLFQLMQQGVYKNNAHNFFKNCTFLVFNYDRCIEHYFEHALQLAYSLPQGICRQIVASANITHLYGAIAPLPWQAVGNQFFHDFGRDRIDCVAAGPNILTYSEYQKNPETETKLLKIYSEADVFVFLGFSFQDQNVSLILDNEFRSRVSADGSSRRRSAIGSAFGFSNFNRDAVAKILQRRLGNNTPNSVMLDNELKCSGVLQNYGRAFS